MEFADLPPGPVTGRDVEMEVVIFHAPVGLTLAAVWRRVVEAEVDRDKIIRAAYLLREIAGQCQPLGGVQLIRQTADQLTRYTGIHAPLGCLNGPPVVAARLSLRVRGVDHLCMDEAPLAAVVVDLASRRKRAARVVGSLGHGVVAHCA